MELKLFKPNIKNVLIGILFFFIIGSAVWVPFYITSNAHGFLESNLCIVELTFLVVVLLISYILSAILVYNFKLAYIKETSLSLKFIIIFLLIKFCGAILLVFDGTISSDSPAFSSMLLLKYSFFPPLTLFLLITAIVFLLIKRKYSWFISSLYFLFLMFNPTSSPMNPSKSTGSIIALFQSLAYGDIISFFFILLHSLFFILIILYLYVGFRNNFKLVFFEKTMFILLIISFLLMKFKIRLITFPINKSDITSLVETVIIFAILLISTKKNFFLRS